MATQYYSDEYYAIFPQSWQPWTDAEIRKLKAEHPQKTFEALSAEMGRTVSAIQMMARKLGLIAHHPWTPGHVAILRANWPRKSAGDRRAVGPYAKRRQAQGPSHRPSCSLTRRLVMETIKVLLFLVWITTFCLAIHAVLTDVQMRRLRHRVDFLEKNAHTHHEWRTTIAVPDQRFQFSRYLDKSELKGAFES
jgi:hypothetical protein